MNSIVKIFTFLSTYTKHIGICGNVGLIAGAIAGTLLSLLDFLNGGITLSLEEALYIALILGGFTWLVILFILCILSKLTFSSIALPSLLNCLLCCFATVFIARYLNMYPYAWAIGIVMGILIGMLLCRINGLLKNFTN